MLSRGVPVLTCVLLLLTLCPDVRSRRIGFGSMGGRWGGAGKAGVGGGGGSWGGAGAHRGHAVGGGHHYKTPHVHSGSSGSNAGKIAGAAAAGALGGMVIGHGLSSMSRPGYGYGHGWHGGYEGYGPGYGGVHNHPRYAGGHGNVHGHHEGAHLNETDMDYYVGSATRGHTYSCALLFGATVWFLISHWIL